MILVLKIEVSDLAKILEILFAALYNSRLLLSLKVYGIYLIYIDKIDHTSKWLWLFFLIISTMSNFYVLYLKKKLQWVV